jgi:hypothetical protein
LEVPHREVALGSVEVQLVPAGLATLAPGEETTLQIENTSADADGNFEIVAGGRGVPPGQYRLAVYQHDRGYDSDRLAGAFSAKKTPIEIDVPEDKLGGSLDVGTIDLNDHLPR